MIKMRNRFTGTLMRVPESRKAEYLKSGHKLFEDPLPIEALPEPEAPKKPAAKKNPAAKKKAAAK